MPQQTLTDNSPWMKALLSLSQDGGGDFNMVDDAQQRASAMPAPASAPPAHRIEDDKAAGIRGTSPQSDQASQPSAITGSIAAGQTTQLADRVQKPPSPLAQRIDENKAKLGSLGTAQAPQTMGDTVLPGGGFWRGLGRMAINAVGGGMGQTRRDEAFKNTLSERTALQSSIDTDTREESREGVTEEGQNLRARMAAQASIAAAQRLGETLRSREGVAASNRDSREGIAADQIAGRADIQSDKPVTRVMGDKTYQYDPSGDTWKEVGKAPINVTRAGNAPVGGFTQPVVNAAGDTVGWINPKLQGDAAFRPVTSIPSAAAAAGGNGALPMKPSGQTASRMQQGDAIQKAGDNLIADVRARASKMGNWSNFWKQMTSGTPLADPDQNYLANQIMSFAALQPAAHGARGLQAIQAFEKAVGGTPTNIEAFIAGVQGIQRGLQPLRPSTPQNPQIQAPPLANRTPPRDAKSFLALYPKGIQ